MEDRESGGSGYSNDSAGRSLQFVEFPRTACLPLDGCVFADGTERDVANVQSSAVVTGCCVPLMWNRSKFELITSRLSFETPAMSFSGSRNCSVAVHSTDLAVFFWRRACGF